MAAPDRSAGCVQVVGVGQLRRALRQAGDDMSDLKDTNREAATIASRAGKSLAPVRTGRLAASIRPAGTKTAAIIRAGKKSVPYANAVHWGRTWWPNKENQRAVSKTSSQPFLSEGAQTSESTWVPLYEDRINQIIDSIGE